jgi:lysophospholipase L1-like esterase
MNSDRVYLVLVPLLRPLVDAINAERKDQFRAAPLVPGNVVFLGDSITQRGFWDAWFPTLPTLNRGIDGDTTGNILGRLDEAILAPVAVNLLVGTNDLHGPRHLRDLDGIASRTTEIVHRIQQAAPDAVVFLNSVMPRTPLLAGRIRSLNDRYRRIATATGASYVDLWPALANPAGGLRKEFTSDNLHLRAPGYRAWTDVLRPHLERFATR